VWFEVVQSLIDNLLQDLCAELLYLPAYKIKHINLHICIKNNAHKGRGMNVEGEGGTRKKEKKV
jgi:hypothetical protein